MNIEQVNLIDGLLWYLETRHWALDKIRNCPRGSLPTDIKMYHYLYFSNLFGAIDLVGDFVRTREGGDSKYYANIKSNFPAPQDYDYARELRNAMVHRGFDPTSAGHANEQFVFALCPDVVKSRDGERAYTCSFKYLLGLADGCDAAANTEMFSALERNGCLELSGMVASRDEQIEFLRKSNAVPDWAKAMGEKALSEMDMDKIGLDIASTRMARLKLLLGRE